MNQPPLLYLSLIDHRYNKIIIWHNKQFLSPKDPTTSSLHCIPVRSVQTQVMMIVHYNSCAPYTPIQTLSMEIQCTQSQNIHIYTVQPYWCGNETRPAPSDLRLDETINCSASQHAQIPTKKTWAAPPNPHGAFSEQGMATNTKTVIRLQSTLPKSKSHKSNIAQAEGLY